MNFTTIQEAKIEIQNIGSDPKSIEIMAPKAVSKAIKVENVNLQDAIIIKQDMLSIGGEVAVPKDAFELKEKHATILIMGTIKQLCELVNKLNRHYSRIQKIANELKEIVHEILL
jgi:dihydropteroate synthase